MYNEVNEVESDKPTNSNPAEGTAVPQRVSERKPVGIGFRIKQ